MRRGGEAINSRNFLLKLNSNLEIASYIEILPPIDLPTPKSQTVRGFEDLRLIEWQGALWCSAAVLEFSPDNRAVQVISRINVEEDGTRRLADWSVMSVDGETRNEKNWMPWVGAAAGDGTSGDLRFIYLCDPTTMIDRERVKLYPAISPQSSLSISEAGLRLFHSATVASPLSTKCYGSRKKIAGNTITALCGSTTAINSALLAVHSSSTRRGSNSLLAYLAQRRSTRLDLLCRE